MRPWLAFVGLSLGACANDRQPSAEAPSEPDTYAVEVLARQVSSPTCVVPSPALEGPVDVVFKDDVAVVDFPSARFEGTVDDQGAFTVALDHRFTFADGCDWHGMDVLTGTYDADSETFDAQLAYSEAPVASARACWNACTVNTNITGWRE